MSEFRRASDMAADRVCGARRVATALGVAGVLCIPFGVLVTVLGDVVGGLVTIGAGLLFQ